MQYTKDFTTPLMIIIIVQNIFPTALCPKNAKPPMRNNTRNISDFISTFLN